MTTATLNRRSFLQVTAAAGGGLLVGTYLPSFTDGEALEAAGVFEPNVWIKVNADDTVRIMLTMLEMGQGVMTSMPMRQVGAAARAMLVTAAAQTWGVAENTCTTDKGEVIHQASGRRLKYGALVDKAAALPVPKTVALKDPKNFKVLGNSLARLDVPEKVNGSAVFGIDVKLPGLLTAKVVRCPVFGGKVARFNADKAKAVPGVKNVVQITNGVAVVADNYWLASRGAQALEVTWDEGPLAKLTSADILAKYRELAQQPGKVARNDGNADATIASSKSFERTFEAPFLAHATMEPMNCTADVRADGCDVYVPTQGQTPSHQAAVAASGLPADKVKVHVTYMGGGFGRRGEADFVMDAVETSKAIGKPVKVIWSREDDMQHDYYRPVSYARMWGAVDGSGKPTVFKQHIVQQSLMKRIGGLPPNGVDFISVDGSANLPYDIPNIRVEYTEHDPGIPFGFWRSVGASFQGFVVEAFIDEMAAAAGKDPFQFRRDLLGKSPRHKAVLELAAEKAEWGKPLAAGRARGIAVMDAFGSYLAQVTEVSVDARGAVRVHRIVCTVDTGWVINPDTIKAQMEGGIVYGLTAALRGEITIKNGRVEQRHFGDYQMLRHNEMPVIEVYIVPSTEMPGGIGEPSTALAAGSLVNAVAAATGRRIYSLPIKADQLRGTA